MTNKEFGTGWPHSDPARLFLSIPKPVSFKKLNPNENRKIPKPTMFTFDFDF